MMLEEFKNKYKGLIIQLQEFKKEREPLDKICLAKEIINNTNPEPVPQNTMDEWFLLFTQEEKIMEEIKQLCHQYFSG